LRLLILVAREGFLKDKRGQRAKKCEYHWFKDSLPWYCYAIKTNSRTIR